MDRYENSLESLTEEEKAKIDGAKDTDTISYFNRTRGKKDEQFSKVRTIPGCFYKVRAQGGASGLDSDEISKFYKRAMITGACLTFHSYATVQFTYSSRILTEARWPRVFYWLPFVVYPMCAVGFVIQIYRVQRDTLARLDSKYTPIWLQISTKLLEDKVD